MKMTACVASLWTVVALGFVLRSGATSTAFTEGLHFFRDENFDNFEVADDADRLVLFTPSLTGCASACSLHAWCTSFFHSAAKGECGLHATVFVLPGLAGAEQSPGTRYYRNEVPWCPPEDRLLYNRPAGMCLYFEGEEASTWAVARDTCTELGMTLASNLTPLKMDAVLNVTRKNPEMTSSIFIGLHRLSSPSGDLTWLNEEALDAESFEPYWADGEPDEDAGEDCVVIEADVSKLDDVSCSTPRFFVCEMLQFPPEM